MLENRLCHVVSLVVLSLALGSCAKEIDTVPAPTGLTMAVFDPSAVPPQIPTPTDLAVDQSTGLLDVPVADATQQPAQAYFDTFLNTLDGYPATATAEVAFTGELDPKTVNENTIRVFEQDPAAPTTLTPVTGLAYEYATVAGTDGNTSRVRIWNYAGWKRGYRYVFYVVSAADKGVKDKNGKAIIRSALFELATADAPLCAWDASKSWDSTTMSCDKPTGGAPATGCCTFNYNGLVESTVKKQVRAAGAAEGKSSEEIEIEVHKKVLETATDFERLRRQGFEPLLALAKTKGISEDDVVVLWSFKVVDLNQVVFNPSATPPQVPTPTDLIRDPQTGMLNIPQNPNASDAEKEFNDYLRSLDGYPSSSPGSLGFAKDLDPTSVDDKSLLVYEVDLKSSPPTATKADNITASWDATNKRVVVSRTGGYKRGTTYVVLAVGSDAAGLKNADTKLATYPRRTALMHLALSPHPLCENFDGKTCGKPLVSSFIDDPKDKTGALTGSQKAALFETIRQGYDKLLSLVVASDSSLKRDNVVALWNFTTSSQSEMLYDPTSSLIPFPNEILYDPTAGKVNIPASANETPSEKALREGLNTLDGFTTLGTYFAPFSGKIDEQTLTPMVSVLAFELATSQPVAMDFKIDAKAGAVTATPTKPLKENTQYGIVLVSKHAASGLKAESGLTDDQGRYLVPSTFMVLLRNRHPVYDSATGKSLVSTVDDATAKAIEEGRLAHKSLFDGLDQLLGIKREDIPAAWVFTTQSISKPATQLRALPWSVLAASDNNTPKLTGVLDNTLAGWPTDPDMPKANVGGLVKGTFKSWDALDQSKGGVLRVDPTKGAAVDINYILTVPKGGAPPAGFPLVVFQHGINNSLRQAYYVADRLAQAGMAMIAFDMVYHGSRTWCTKDDDCAGGGTCTVATGKCTTSLKDSDGDGEPDASGGDKFLNVSNPFAIRDAIRQHVVDAAALLRTIALGGVSGITGNVKVDPSKVYMVGHSLGAIVNVLVLATDSLPVRGSLSAPGSPVADIFLAPDGGQAWTSIKQKVLQGMGVQEGTLDYLQLLTTFTWIMDPADPGNFGRFVTTTPLDDLVKTGAKIPLKKVLVQLGGNDTTIPNQFGQFVADSMSVDTSKSVFANQGHSVLLRPSPSAAAHNACTAQMVNFLNTGTICTPNIATGTCN